MNKILPALALVSLPAGLIAQPADSLCCKGLARPFAGGFNLPMVSKFALDAEQVCPSGSAVRAISFRHASGQNLTYQESFALQCATSPGTVTAACTWGPLVSNFPTSTKAAAPGDSVVSGIRFRHAKDQNLTYQQSYAIRWCRLARPRPRTYPRGTPASSTTKFHPDSNAACMLNVGGALSGLVVAVGFSHPKGLDGTHQEMVYVTCSYD